jgi:hypothetical protein
MNYTDYINQIATMAIVPVADPNFQIIIPQMINYAELRIQRDLDLFAGQTVNTSYLTSLGSPTVTLQDADFITIQSVSLAPTGGVHTPLLPTTKEYLQYVYPSGSTQAAPQYFSMYSTNTVTTQGGGSAVNGLPSFSIRLGPIPDAVYPLTINGTLHTQPISSTNTTTWISTYLPDLFIMASMIYISAYQRNFGRQSDDPAMAQSYESQYKGLLMGAATEEFRKKFQASAWTSMSPSPVATTSR